MMNAGFYLEVHTISHSTDEIGYLCYHERDIPVIRFARFSTARYDTVRQALDACREIAAVNHVRDEAVAEDLNYFAKYHPLDLSDETLSFLKQFGVPSEIRKLPYGIEDAGESTF